MLWEKNNHNVLSGAPPSVVRSLANGRRFDSSPGLLPSAISIGRLIRCSEKRHNTQRCKKDLFSEDFIVGFGVNFIEVGGILDA